MAYNTFHDLITIICHTTDVCITSTLTDIGEKRYYWQWQDARGEKFLSRELAMLDWVKHIEIQAKSQLTGDKNSAPTEILKWREIDYLHLPTKEVLAANFTPGTSHYNLKLLGYLVFDMGRIQCNNEQTRQMIDCCTHYIDVENIKIPSKPDQDFMDSKENTVSIDPSERLVRPVAPGEILLDILDSLEMSCHRLAGLMEVHPKVVKEIISGRQTITPHIAARIGKALGNGDRLWLNLQKKVDAWDAAPK